MSDGDSDETLLGPAIAGEPFAMEQLLLRHQTRLLGWIRRHVPDGLQRVFAPEDVFQETCVEAFRGIGAFRPRGRNSFYRWLLRIARNRLIDIVRAEQAEKRGGGRRLVDPRVGDSSIAPLVEQLHVDSHTPSRSVAGHEVESLILVALAGLKSEYREALQLRFVKGLSVSEAAEQMSRSEWSIHKLCSRGLQRLRESLGEHSEDLGR